MSGSARAKGPVNTSLGHSPILEIRPPILGITAWPWPYLQNLKERLVAHCVWFSQGQRPGQYQPGAQPQVRDQPEVEGCKPDPSFLIPKVRLVVFHVVSIQKHPEFVLKRLVQVMFGLTIDIVNQGIEVLGSNGKTPISALP